MDKCLQLKCILWVVAEFRHNEIVKSPSEIYFNIGQQLQRKQRSKTEYVIWGLTVPPLPQKVAYFGQFR